MSVPRVSGQRGGPPSTNDNHLELTGKVGSRHYRENLISAEYEHSHCDNVQHGQVCRTSESYRREYCGRDEQKIAQPLRWGSDSVPETSLNHREQCRSFVLVVHGQH